MSIIIEKKILNIRLIEWILIGLFAIALGFVLAKNAGGPQYSDELWYMDLGLNGKKDYLVLNYYFHVYLQKIFLEIASRPVAGAKLYWSFVVTITCALVYLCIRWMRQNNSVIHGIFGVFILLSYNVFPLWAGATKVDFSSMMMTTLVVALYILAINNRMNQHTSAFLIGVLLFLCLKTKETTVLIAILLSGFGYINNQFSWKKFLSCMKFMLLGIAIGLIFFMVLSAIIVKDFFWGIRPSDWIQKLITLRGLLHPLDDIANWYDNGVSAIMFVPFLLYVISGTHSLINQQYEMKEKVLWIHPLLFLGVLTVAYFTKGFWIEDRQILPIIPIICILAVQSLEFSHPQTRKQYFLILLIFVVSVALVIGLIFLFEGSSLYVDWTWIDYFKILITPLAISILLVSLFLKANRSWIMTGLSVACLTLIFLPKAIDNVNSIVIKKTNFIRMQQMYYPFATFGKDIHYSEKMRLYISPTIPSHLQMLMHRKEEIVSMFNLYFDENSTFDNFIFPTVYDPRTGEYSFEEPIQSIAAMQYDQAIISRQDWEYLETIPEYFDLVNEYYDFKADDTNTLLFLTQK